MAVTKVVELKVNDNLAQTEKSVASLKAQLRQAQEEVVKLSDKFGATSKQAVEAAKRAAELKDQIGDAKTLTDAFNPDAKFKALSSSLAGVAGGYAAVSGATSLLGLENKGLEEQLLKVQSAMAVSQGLQSIGESIDSFKQLGAVVKSQTIIQKLLNFVQGEGTTATIVGTVATEGQAVATGVTTVATTGLSTAMKVLRATIVSTGIGALVVLVGYLISAMQDSAEATEDQKKAQERLNVEIARTSELVKTEIGLINDNAKVKKLQAEIAGKSTEELSKIEQKASDERIDALHLERDTLLETLNNKILTAEQTIAINKRLTENQKEVTAEINGQEIARLEYMKETANKRRDEIKAQHEKELAERKRLNDERLAKEKEFQKQLEADLKEFNDKINAGNLDRYNTEAENRKEKDDLIRSLRYQSDIDELNDERAKAEKLLEAANASQEEFMLLGESFRQRQEELENKHEVSKIEKYNEGIENEKLSYEARYNLLDSQNKLILESDTLTEQQRTEMLAENQEARNAIRDAEYEHNKKIASASSNLLGQAADLAGKHTAAGKGLAVAQALISTYVSAVDSYKGMVAAIPGPVGIAGGVVAAAFSIASGLATVKKIMSVKTPGGSGSAGSDAGSASPSVAPSFNVVGTSSNNQLAQSIGRQQNQPVEAFVVGSSVTSQQALDRNRIQVATFN